MAQDAVTLILEDHRTFQRYFRELKSTQGDSTECARLLDQIGPLLLAHHRAEEEKVYPLISRRAPEEQPEVGHVCAEHAEAERLFDLLRQADPASLDFARLRDDFVDTVQRHFEEEESQLLTILDEVAGEQTRAELGRAFWDRRQEELRRIRTLGLTGSELAPVPG